MQTPEYQERMPLAPDERWGLPHRPDRGTVVGRPCASRCFSCVKAVSRATAGPVSGSVLSSEKTGSGERSGGTSVRSFSGTNADAIRKGILEAPNSHPDGGEHQHIGSNVFNFVILTCIREVWQRRIIAFRVWSGKRNHAGP